MLESHWMAVGAFSLVMTLGWLFVDVRVTTTGLLAAMGWITMALTGDTLERITQDGSRVDASAGVLVWLCTALAILSLLAVLLYQFDAYPPETEDPKEVMTS